MESLKGVNNYVKSESPNVGFSEVHDVDGTTINPILERYCKSMQRRIELSIRIPKEKLKKSNYEVWVKKFELTAKRLKIESDYEVDMDTWISDLIAIEFSEIALSELDMREIRSLAYDVYTTAYDLLYTSISDDMAYLADYEVMETGTAPRILKSTLRDEFTMISEMEKQELVGIIVNTKMENHEFAKYISTIQKARTKLQNYGLPIEEDLLKALVMAKLPEDYEMVKTAINMSTDKSWSKVKKEIHTAAQAKVRKEVVSDKAESYSAHDRTKDRNQKPYAKDRNARKGHCRFFLRGNCIKGNKCDYIHDEKKKKEQKEKGKAKAQKATCNDDESSDSGWIVMEEATALAAAKNGSRNAFYIDSACTRHLCDDRSLIRDVKPCKEARIDVAKTGEQIIGNMEGKVDIQLSDGSTLTLKNVLYTPDSGVKLLSVRRFTERGCTLTISSKECKISEGKRTLLTAEKIGALWGVNAAHKTLAAFNLVKTPKSLDYDLLHRRLGHPSRVTVEHLAKKAGTGIKMKHNKKNEKSEGDTCSTCALTKLKGSAVSKKPKTISRVRMMLAHSDVLTLPVRSRGGYKYALSLIEDYSRLSIVRLLRKKSDLPGELMIAIRTLQLNAGGERLRALRCDSAPEYLQDKTKSALLENGTLLDPVTPGKHQMNGVAERWNGTVSDGTRALLKNANLDNTFWGEAIMTANTLRNFLPQARRQNQSPYELFYGKLPNLSFLRTFGCRVFTLTAPEQRKKLDDRSKEGLLLGYDLPTKCYRAYMQDTKKIRKTVDIMFKEEEFPGVLHENNKEQKELQHEAPPSDLSKEMTLNLIEPLPLIMENETIAEAAPPPAALEERSPSSPPEVTAQEENVTHIQKIQEDKSTDPPTIADDVKEDTNSVINDAPTDTAADNKRGTNIPPMVPEETPPKLPRMSRRFMGLSPEETAHIAYAVYFEGEPKSYKEAKADPEWKKSMDEELASLDKHGTYIVKKTPKGRKPISCKWVYKQKKDEKRQETTKKSRLVVRGFKQVAGLDYGETFSPVVSAQAARLVFALAFYYDFNLWQLDVRTAFLHGDIDTEIYMEPPEGYKEKLEEGYSLLLLKALYGLKQAGKLWYEKLRAALKAFGFEPLITDPCVYVLKKDGKIIAILLIYVDDMVLGSRFNEVKKKLLTDMDTLFEMKDLGPLKYFLGIHLQRSKYTLTLSQEGFSDKILERFNMTDCNPAKSPGTVNKKQEEDTDMDLPLGPEVPYREAVGSLIYLAVWTRPDIAHSVSQVSRHLENPRKSDWQAVKKILRYIQGTKDRAITYTRRQGQEPPRLTAFADANWGEDETDSKSTTGYAIYLLGSLIAWKTKKQSTVAKSSTEAEYMALSDATAEVIGLRQMLGELGCPQTDPTDIGEDNQGALLIAKNKATNKRTKHIRIRYHHIRDEIEKKQVNIVRVPTQQQTADIFTKALPTVKFARAMQLLDKPEALLD
jgi:hypothetical protein